MKLTIWLIFLLIAPKEVFVESKSTHEVSLETLSCLLAAANSSHLTPSAESELRRLLGSSSATDTVVHSTEDAADNETAASHDSHGSSHGGHAVYGTHAEHVAAMATSWACLAISVIILIFYGYHSWKASCGWEEVYVCIVELVKVIVELVAAHSPPATIHTTEGQQIVWLRYAEWLLSCPVILIHLCNLTGLKDNYSKRTMRLLVADIGTIVFGVCAAFSTGPAKVLLFLVGCVYGVDNYFQAAKVYLESYHMVPKGECQLIVKYMAYIFFVSWISYPLFFAAGPEGLGIMSQYGSHIAHVVSDIFAKNLWGLLGHELRNKIQEHVLTHGDLRKKAHITVAGEEIEFEKFLDQDEAAEEEDVVENDVAALAAKHRGLANLAKNMKNRGKNVRWSQCSECPTLALQYKESDDVSPGRVVLGLPDLSLLSFMREQFNKIVPQIDPISAVGADMIIPMVKQSLAMGPLDCVFLHPELLRDSGSGGLVAKLKQLGCKVVTFGWGQMSAYKSIIEASGCDAWMEGFGFGSGLDSKQLVSILTRVQQVNAQGTQIAADWAGSAQLALSTLGHHANMGTSITGNPLFTGNFGGNNTAALNGNSFSNVLTQAALELHQMTNSMVSREPSGLNLLNGLPSMLMTANDAAPLLPQQSLQASAALTNAGGTTTPQSQGQDAEAINQLMSEITKLKSELQSNPW